MLWDINVIHQKQQKYVASSLIVKKNKHALSSSFNFRFFVPSMFVVISMTKQYRKCNTSNTTDRQSAYTVNLLLLIIVIIIHDGMHSMVKMAVVVPSYGLLLTQT